MLMLLSCRQCTWIILLLYHQIKANEANICTLRSADICAMSTLDHAGLAVAEYACRWSPRRVMRRWCVMRISVIGRFGEVGRKLTLPADATRDTTGQSRAEDAS